jgi:hypothetical protein
MRLSYREMMDCTWAEFDYLQRGHNRRVERLWDVGRHLMASMYNSSGFSKKAVKPNEIMKLPFLDGIGKPVKAEKMKRDDVNKLMDVLNNKT